MPILPLALGSANLLETWRSIQVAPGVVCYEVQRGQKDPGDHFALETRPGIHSAPDNPQPAPTVASQRTGSFATRAEAAAAGSNVVYTGEDGLTASGPWSVHILDVDLDKFQGQIGPALNPQARTRVSDLVKQNHAIAGVNGGYFVEHPEDGTPGDPMGISVFQGQLLSESIRGRSSLVLPENGDPVMGKLESHTIVSTTDGAHCEVSGLNRELGKVRCGAPVGGRPRHDSTLRTKDDLVVFDSHRFPQTPPGVGTEVGLDENGLVLWVDRSQRGHAVPVGGKALAGIGREAQWLLSNVHAGEHLSVDSHFTLDGEPAPPVRAAINAGPELVRNGKVSIDGWAEGFDRDDAPAFYHSFGERRNARTMVGTTENHHLLIVTVDGHQPDKSIGVTFEEGAHLMQSLGCGQAINFDGGGSTAMATPDGLLNQPSDPSGEREVGDGLLLFPGP